MRFVTLVLSAAIAATPALSQPRTYDGAQLQALVCAYVLSHGANRMLADGRISAQEHEVRLDKAMDLLDRYAEGTETEKVHALFAMSKRPEMQAILKEADGRARQCQAQFPV